MKMLRSTSTLSSNRSLLVVLVLLVALVAIAVIRTVVGNSFAPAVPIYLPAENRASPPPPVEASPVPAPAAPAPGETAIPATDTAVPARAPIYPAAVPAATAVPHATAPVVPQTTAGPGDDIHSIAPEGIVPGLNPPPGRE